MEGPGKGDPQVITIPFQSSDELPLALKSGRILDNAVNDREMLQDGSQGPFESDIDSGIGVDMPEGVHGRERETDVPDPIRPLHNDSFHGEYF
jgi:hypothetical protein